MNLLYISALNRRGFAVLFNKTGIEIRRKDTLVATGIMKGNRSFFLRAVVTALYTTEEEATPIFEESVGEVINVSTGAFDASKNHQKNFSPTSNQKEDVFRL